MKKMATFELVDDSIVKEALWEDFDMEEEVSFWMENSGYDSNQFQFSLGFPLYCFGLSVLLLFMIPAIQVLRMVTCP